MEDNEFFFKIFKLVATVTAVLITTIGGCTVAESVMVTRMTEKGVDPVLARCAIGSQDSAFNILCAQRQK